MTNEALTFDFYFQESPKRQDVETVGEELVFDIHGTLTRLVTGRMSNERSIKVEIRIEPS